MSGKSEISKTTDRFIAESTEAKAGSRLNDINNDRSKQKESGNGKDRQISTDRQKPSEPFPVPNADGVIKHAD